MTTRSDPTRQTLVEECRPRFAALPAQLCHAARGVVEREDATSLLAGATG